MSVAKPAHADPQLSELELHAWKGFLHAHAVLVHELDAELEAAHGLPLTSLEVLAQLDAAPDRCMRMRDLADAVLLSRSGLTRLVDRLVAGGLIERRSCQTDARGAFAALTVEGRRVLGEALPTHRAGVRRLFLDRFDAAELTRMAACWERVATPEQALPPADKT